MIVLVTYPRAPARTIAITSSGASDTDSARNRWLRPLLHHLLDHLDPAATRHVDVEQDDLGLKAPGWRETASSTDSASPSTSTSSPSSSALTPVRKIRWSSTITTVGVR